MERPLGMLCIDTLGITTTPSPKVLRPYSGFNPTPPTKQARVRRAWNDRALAVEPSNDERGAGREEGFEMVEMGV